MSSNTKNKASPANLSALFLIIHTPPHKSYDTLLTYKHLFPTVQHTNTFHLLEKFYFFGEYKDAFNSIIQKLRLKAASDSESHMLTKF
jgi:hypothetical protein